MLSLEENSITKCMSFTSGSTGGEYKHKMLIDELASHDHIMTKNRNWGNANYGGTNSPAWSSESISADNLTSKTGNSQPFNIMQPYYVVSIWKRTA